MSKEHDLHHIHELHPELLKAFMSAFLNRTDCYPLQLDKGDYVRIRKPLQPDMVRAHLKGLVTIGAYALDVHSNAKWLVYDADTQALFDELRYLKQGLEQQRVPSYLETSRRGGHLWLFTQLLSGSNIRQFGRQLLAEYQMSNDIELYPKQDRVVKTGSHVRLPFGVHRMTGKRYRFITSEGEPLAPTIREQIALLAHPIQVPQSFIDQRLTLAPEPKPVSPTPSFEHKRKGSGEYLSDVLKSTISVEAFVSQFVPLDAQGKGFCPFHDDQKMSFSVNVEGNYWQCFAGCKGQTIIDFWMLWRTKHGQDGSFTETVKELRKMLL